MKGYDVVWRLNRVHTHLRSVHFILKCLIQLREECQSPLSNI
uniref:Uncharacterized protein n=1 Tax=Anguilla anguilla TaxID=7936 RepID=A0A0E9SBC4_ANGAN